MNGPTYRVISSKALSNGDVLIRVATDDKKYRTRRVKPSQGGGIEWFFWDKQGLVMFVAETLATSDQGSWRTGFFASEKTSLAQIQALREKLPRVGRIIINPEPVQAPLNEAV